MDAVVTEVLLRIPVLVTRNFVLYPGRTVPLLINRPQSVAAVTAGQDTFDGRVIVVSQRHETGDGSSINKGEVHLIGVLARIDKKVGDAKKGFQLVVTGLERVALSDVDDRDAYLSAQFKAAPDLDDCDDVTGKALLANAKILAKEILGLIPGDTSHLESILESVTDLQSFLSIVMENIDVSMAKRQEILEVDSRKRRALAVLELMAEQKKTLEIQVDVRNKLNEKIGKHQREAILREQIKTIRDELGETKSEADEDYFRKIADANLPESVKTVAIDEAKRLDSIGSSSPETHVIRNYLDFILAMPWNSSTEDHLDLKHARQVLNSDHHGLEKIKNRIIQHLAVMKLKKDKRGSILLLVGPPGVGKTSLGGVRDDAEIRGHRKTYVGAMPGRIVQSIKRVGVRNPVFLLDEIDKLGRGYSGDPAAALLEVLDPEQNKEFTDHYLDVPFDLSDVFFIATANTLDSIPGPLLDRMEVIEVSGYITSEKLAIARDHLVPKQLEEHGLRKDQVTFTDSALLTMIQSYTREAGVRGLQRLIQTLCRYAAEKIADATVLSLTISNDQVRDALGSERFEYEGTERVVPPGVVTGLAWTPVGGDVLFVESAQMTGSGRLILTGQLGDVMKESAQIALSLVRSNLAVFLKVTDFDKRDIHIHVPSGAIPKDGPSAGVTMLTSLASLLTGFRVNPKLAMTGEVTLRGQVTPVGGIKEKILAAHRSGVDHILIPKRNEKDLTDVPAEVLSQVSITFVEHVSQVLEIALGIHDAFFPTMPPTAALPGAVTVVPS
jgi:ATP-dependent Lon protease